ncbi:MAG TPA: hypothetical protein VF002_01870 [Gaiellaceae bacterium]
MRSSRRQRKPSSPRRPLYLGAAIGAAAAVFISTSVALAAFSSSVTGGGASLATKRIFPGVRSAWPWDIRDAAAGGAEVNATDPLAYSDSVLATTGNWTSTFSATRFDDFDFNAGLPGGISVTSAIFNFTFASSQANKNACFYIEVRRASTNTLLGTHGSSGTPSACANAGAQVAATVDISAEVTSTDIANDLRIRVYADQSSNKAINIDLATVTLTTPYMSSTALAHRWDDEATGAPAVTLWSPYAVDGSAYTSGLFATAFSATRYLKFTPNEAVPAGSAISSADVQFAYKSAAAGDQTCWYFEVYNGTTLIGTHGSSASPVSCNSTTSYVTNNVSLPELSTVAAANNVVIKAYLDNSGSRAASIDLVQLDVNYYLD